MLLECSGEKKKMSCRKNQLKDHKLQSNIENNFSFNKIKVSPVKEESSRLLNETFLKNNENENKVN